MSLHRELASPSPILVRLDAAELAHAKVVAQRRVDGADGLSPRFAYEGGFDNPLDRHFRGCCGEIAFCHVLGVPWPARVDTFRRLPDVDPDWEVRHSWKPELKVTRRDNLFYRAVLVVGGPPNLRVVGWMRVAHALNHYPETDPGDRQSPAVFVPAADLEPFDG